MRTISGTPLPTITDQITIDGTTQPGFAGSPLIELSGANAAAGSNGLVVNAQDSVIRGLIVNRWTGSGIVLQGPAAISVVGSWIGTASDGTTAAGNEQRHPDPDFRAPHRRNDGGRTQRHLGQHDRREHRILDGPRQRGHRQLHRDRSDRHARRSETRACGVLVDGEANVIGGPGTGNGNVISGNDQAGVLLTGGATANSVLGNIIGVNASGTGALGNGIGVQVGVNTDGTASTNFIGGVNAGEGNEIAFSTTIGVMVGQSSTNNAIFGNSIHQNGTLGIDLARKRRHPERPRRHRRGRQQPEQLPGAQCCGRRRSGDAQQHPGHDVPDRVLRQYGVRRVRQRRGSDIPRRYGGHDRRDRQRHDSVLCCRGGPVRHRDGYRLVEQHVGVLESA